MFLADVESRLDKSMTIDDNHGIFYQMPNTSDKSKTNGSNLNALMGYLSCSEEELENFCNKSSEKGFVVPNKVLVLKNAKWWSFTFKRYEHGMNNPGKVNPTN